MVTCKLGEKGCWNDGKCRLKPCSCENQVVTNADRIRAMSDEELCDLFREIYNAGCDDSTAYSWGRNTYSFVWNEKWLHAPAEGE